MRKNVEFTLTISPAFTVNCSGSLAIKSNSTKASSIM